MVSRGLGSCQPPSNIHWVSSCDYFADVVYWTELHPDEGGINVLYSFQNSDQQMLRWTKSSVSISSRVHEYGGGTFIVYDGAVYYVDHSDQKIHMMKAPLKDSVPLTREADMRYADCAFHPNASKFVCVREDHSVVKSGARKEAENTIVLVDIASQTVSILVSIVVLSVNCHYH